MTLIEALKEIGDPRSYHGKEYQLWEILLVTILCILTGGKTYADVRRFLEVHYAMLKMIFKFRWRHLPDESAIRKIIVAVDPAEIERVFRDHMRAGWPAGGGHICFDGKSLNGSFSHTKDKRAAQVFSAFCGVEGIVLAHAVAGTQKNHEIQAFREFLSTLDLRGVVVTADAVHCQKKHLNAPRPQARF